MNRIDVDAVNALRVLAADEVQKANSGHPGLPLGAAPAAYAVWAYEMKHNPKNPRWENRDRFILSGGHGSALLYALLHLFGYVWGDRIFEKCGIGRDERGDGGKTLEIRGKRRLSARDGGANYQQS